METLHHQTTNGNIRTFLKSGLFLVLMLLCSFPALADKLESIKKKEISKSFNTGSSDVLEVDNRFGNITVTHWNKNEVSIQVLIEVKARNEERAQANLDRIQINMEKSGRTISAITTLRNQNGNGGNNESFSINYYIKMPANLTADLTQKYGNINMPENNKGKCDLHVKYGNINAGSFTESLNIDAQYGNVDLGTVKTANLDVAYCGNVTLSNANTLNIDSKYSNLNLQDVDKINMEIKYGNFGIENLANGSIEIKYSQGSIQTLKKELYIDALSYSTLNIREVNSDFSSIYAEAHYGNLNINIPSRASFKVKADNMKYGNYSIKGFNVTNSSVEDKVNFRSEINGGKKGRIEFEGNNYSNLKVRTK